MAKPSVTASVIGARTMVLCRPNAPTWSGGSSLPVLAFGRGVDEG